MKSFDHVVALGRQLDKPKSINVRLLREDYQKLVDCSEFAGSSLDCFVRGILLSFLNMYDNPMITSAPDQEVAYEA